MECLTTKGAVARFSISSFILITVMMACQPQIKIEKGIPHPWQSSQDSDTPALDLDYTQDAIRIIDNIEIFEGKDAVLKSIENITPSKLRALSHHTPANKDSTIFYGIGGYKINGSEYAQLFISQKEAIELEIVIKKSEAEIDLEAIRSARSKWMTLCNSHDVAALVNNMYTEDAIYFNHKPLIHGREKLIATYSYMARPEYSLNLDPFIVETINANTVFEVGQCSGSYNGKYVIIWKKQDSGEWQVWFDSNI